MDKNTILDYVTETPGNTNRAVLGSMLDSLSNSGSGGGSFCINLINNESLLDKTWKEIHDAIENNQFVFIRRYYEPADAYNITLIQEIYVEPEYTKPYIVGCDGFAYYAANENDYPSTDME